MKIENTADLRRFLLQAMAEIHSGEMDGGQGRAISVLSSQVLKSASLDLEAARMASEIGRITPTLLISGGEEVTHSYPDLTNSEYAEILAMKKGGKSLPAVAEQFKTKDKKLIGAVYHNKPFLE